MKEKELINARKGGNKRKKNIELEKGKEKMGVREYQRGEVWAKREIKSPTQRRRSHRYRTGMGGVRKREVNIKKRRRMDRYRG